MAYITIRQDYVDVLGYIWQPGMGLCSLRINLSPYDLGNIGEFTRENVEQWLARNAGDFQSIVDFSATSGHDDISWANPDSEFTFSDTMYGSADD